MSTRDDLTTAGRVIAREAERYLSACHEFAAAGHDPHSAARTRARLARLREDCAATEKAGDEQRREKERAARIAARERRLEQARGPFRYAPCDVHGKDPCPDDCPTYTGRLRAAGLDRREEA